MSLLPFLIVTGVGATAALLFRGRERVATGIGFVALVLAVVTSIAMRPGPGLVVADGGLAATEYLRLFLVLGSLAGLLLLTVGQVTGTRRDAPAVTLGILATSAVALAVPDARAAVLAATAGGAFGALLTWSPLGGRLAATAGTRVLRATVVAGTMAIAATAWIGRDLTELAAQPVVFGLAYLTVALAVAIRFGAIPLHTWAARLTDAIPETTLPLVTAIAPAAFAIVALAWADRNIAPLLVELDSVRAVVLAIAIASIVLATVAALIQDDIEHIVGYAIVGDAGVVLLAVAALDPAAWAPARIWILAFVVARSAFAAWAAVARSALGTGRMQELRGWALRMPGLAVILAIVALASIGIPGLAAFDARTELVTLSLDGPLAAVVLLATFGPLLYYARLALVGVSAPSPNAARSGGPGSAAGGRPTIVPLDLTDVRGWAGRAWAANRLPGAFAGATLLAVLALAVSAGAFGISQAAAGLPPSLDGVEESFTPGGPVEPEEPVDSDAPEVEPSGEVVEP